MYVWRNIHRLVDRFSKPITYKRMLGETYSEDEGLPVVNYETVSLIASIQPVRKKGAIGGENELYLNVEADGNWEFGAFVMISKSDFKVNIRDEVKDLTINGKNYGDAFIDRVQDWSEAQGHYKVRVLLKSIYPTREDFDSDMGDLKITPTILIPPVTEEDLYYGDTLSTLSLYGGDASVDGEFEWQTPNATPTTTSTQLAKFIPTDTHNYKEVDNINVLVTVSQVPIKVATPPTASEIASGAELGTSELTGGSVVEERNSQEEIQGTWSWSEPDTIVTESGEHLAIFIADDDAKYGDITLDIEVPVS